MSPTPTISRWLNILLWLFQVLLALLFLNAGFMKTFQPIQEIAPTIFWATRFPELFVRFIGIAEILGAAGLIFPAMLMVRPRLTTLAAACLAATLLCANIYHVVQGEFFVLPMTATIFLVIAFVAYGRWKLSPF
jgi:putative oxidoreductase